MANQPIDPERLAALLDGTLSPSEREILLAELAAGGEAYDDLIEASALLAAMSGQPSLPNPARSAGEGPRRPAQTPTATHRARLFAVLAPVLAAAGIVAMFVVVRGRSVPTVPSAAEVAETLSLRGPSGANSIARTLGADWNEPEWPASRGITETLAPRARAFRAGARFAELQLALASRDMAAVQASAGFLVPLASEVETGAPTAARMSLLARGGVASMRGQQSRIATELRELFGEPTWFDLGAWTESARLAAKAHQGSFFAPDHVAMRRLRHLIVALDRLDADGRLAAESIVDRLRRLDGKPAPSAEQLEAIASGLDSTVAEGGR